MSIGGALNTAVSGLKAQSTAISIISDNLANSETIGYKANSTKFSTLVTGNVSSTAYASGGVRATSRAYVGAQGLITTSSNTTDIAIDGGGMFAVTDGVDGEVLYFTRNGQFSEDSEGYLTNGSYVLQGWPLDEDGNIDANNTNSSSSLEPVDLTRFNSSAAATDLVTLTGNLPSTSEVEDDTTSDLEGTYTTSSTLYDSLGGQHDITLTWTKTDENTWTVNFSDPTSASSSSDDTATGTVGGNIPYTVTFDGEGKLASITDSEGTDCTTLDISVTGWTTGAEDSDISFNIGTVGSTDGMTQYSPSDPDAELKVTLDSNESNGLRYGKMNGVEINTDGTVVASYDNGDSVEIYKIPVATFANYDGLELNSNGVYEATIESGSFTLSEAGSGAAGEVKGSSLESSTTDTAEEFSKMIVCQQAYSAASQVVTACNDMFDTLMGAVR